MQYKATIYFGTDSMTQMFPTIIEAASWIDSENNNLEYASKIESVDKDGKTVENYNHTEKHNE